MYLQLETEQPATRYLPYLRWRRRAQDPPYRTIWKCSQPLQQRALRNLARAVESRTNQSDFTVIRRVVNLRRRTVLRSPNQGPRYQKLFRSPLPWIFVAIRARTKWRKWLFRISNQAIFKNDLMDRVDLRQRQLRRGQGPLLVTYVAVNLVQLAFLFTSLDACRLVASWMRNYNYYFTSCL